MELGLKTLRSSVAEHAAFRRRQRLQPVGGVGDKVFPPTYPGEGRDSAPRHVFETRLVNGVESMTVLLDSVQSSANRAEEALLGLATVGSIDLPYLVVDFAGSAAPEVGTITSLDAPHRVFDAIFRDSQLNGVPLMRSDLGRKLQLSKPGTADPLFEASPNALLFGAWNSTGEGGGLGAKFPRCFVSEIVGYDVPVTHHEGKDEPTPAGRRPGSRMDPLGILKAVPVFKAPKGSEWDSSTFTGAKKGKPSEINHGNIAPSITEAGVTMAYAEHSLVISFAALRRLRFASEAQSIAARTVLAALGLVAHISQMRAGYALRSRCDLVCDGAASLELVRFDGDVEVIEIDLDQAIALYQEAVAAARASGFTFNKTPVQLQPQEKLVYLVSKSRELALSGQGGETEGADAGT